MIEITFAMPLKDTTQTRTDFTYTPPKKSGNWKVHEA